MAKPKTRDDLTVGARLAGHSTLRDVRTFHINAEVTTLPSDDSALGYEFDFTVADGHVSEDTLIVSSTGELALFEVQAAANGEDGEKSEVGMISFTIASLYSLRTPADGSQFTDEELHAFSQSTARFSMYPYARSLVADLSAKLGLPTLTVPPLRISLPRPKGARKTNKEDPR